MGGETDMAKLTGVIRDYNETCKTGFIERAVLTRDLELAYSATFNKQDQLRHVVYYSHRAMLAKWAWITQSV